MVKCPKCSEEIDHLEDSEMVWAKYQVKLSENKEELEFEGEGEITDSADEDGSNIHYYCPKCNEEVADNYSNAIAVLKSEKIEE